MTFTARPTIVLTAALAAGVALAQNPDPDAAARFTVTREVSRPAEQVPPFGVNNLGDPGAFSYASNNMVLNPGNEPISFRDLVRVTNAAENWFEIDRGGVSRWDLWRSGFLSGADVRVYRIVDAEGNPLPVEGSYLNLENAERVDLIREDRIIPPGAPDFPAGGWVANRYTTPHVSRLDTVNLRYTDGWSIQNGQQYYYTVQAIDGEGNESEYAAEVTVTPSAEAQDAPRILVRNSDPFPEATVGQPFGQWGGGFEPLATGGQEPLTWALLDFSGNPQTLPDGLNFDPNLGAITGTPSAEISSLELRFQVTDADGLTDTRDYILNPGPSEPADVAGAPEPPQNLSAVANDGSVTLTWEASPSADVAAYRVLRSTAPEAEQEERAYLEGDGPALRPHDYVFIEERWMEFDDSTISPRVRTLSNSEGKPGWPWRPLWGAEEAFEFSLEPHGENLPAEFFEPGETSLRVDVAEGSHRLFQVVFFGTSVPDTQEDLFYGQLQPGAQYRMEVWLRQEGLGNGGQVSFGYSDGYPSIRTDFQVTGEWQRYTYDFTAPERPGNVWHHGHMFEMTGPGVLWMDNARIFRADREETRHQPWTLNPEILEALLANQPATGRKGALRSFGTMLYNEASLDSLLNYYAVESKVTVDWFSSIGDNTKFTLPMLMEYAMATGDSPETRMRPWLTLQIYFSEEEWGQLIEYLAAPYDPENDTPDSKPYAYRRVQHRGGDTTPWIDEFETIILELGNETWHNAVSGLPFEGYGPFGAVWQGGLEYGLFYRRLIDSLRATPYWASENLDEKIVFSAGGGYEASFNEGDGTDWYGETAAQQSVHISSVGHATYVGPRWETSDVSPETFTDDGVQETLLSHPTGTREDYRQYGRVRDLLASRGFDYDIMAYEGGPSGFALPEAGNPLVSEAAELYGKSLAMAVAAMDSWLDAYHFGWTEQCYYNFGQGPNWNSHTMAADGFRPSPGWLAQTMRNRYASGDLMIVNTESVPEMLRNETERLPLADCEVFHNNGRWAVIVLSRKLDEATPVTINLPAESVESVTLHRLTGDPRANNLEAMTIEIETINLPATAFDAGTQSFTIDENTGGVEGGIPPGSIYLYVLTESENDQLSDLWKLE